jgi:hypothetical protein
VVVGAHGVEVDGGNVGGDRVGHRMPPAPRSCVPAE